MRAQILRFGLLSVAGMVIPAASLKAELYVSGFGSPSGEFEWDSLAQGLDVYALPGVPDSLGCNEGPDWAPTPGSTILGCSFEGGYNGQQPATPTFFRLTEFQLAVESFYLGHDPLFNVALYSSTSGAFGFGLTMPDAPLVIATDITAPSPFLPLQVTDINIVNGPVIESGQEYFVVVTPADSNSVVGWETSGVSSLPIDDTLSPTGDGG